MTGDPTPRAAATAGQDLVPEGNPRTAQLWQQIAVLHNRLVQLQLAEMKSGNDNTADAGTDRGRRCG